jgi:hypothetical protein
MSENPNLALQFSQALERELRSYPEYIKSSRTIPDGELMTTYSWTRRLMIDVVDNECCFTATGKHIVYDYDHEDMFCIVNSIMEEVHQVFLTRSQ